MIVKLLTEHHLEFLSLKEEAQTCLSLHLSKCQIVGNLMPRLIFQLICLSPSYDHFFAANNEYLPLTNVVILTATQGLDCIKQFERA